jgi:hypothetical protein
MTTMVTGNYVRSTTSPLGNLTFLTAKAAEAHKKEFIYIVGQSPTDMQIDKTMGFEGFGAAPRTNEAAAPETRAITESYTDSIRQEKYQIEMAMTIEQQMFSMKNADFIGQMAKMRAESIALAYDYNAVVPYTDGFATEVTSDAAYVFSASHVWRSDSSNFSNLLTTAEFSAPALGDALKQIAQQEKESNVKIDVMPKEIRYGTEYILTIKEVLKTMKDPDTANNTYNAVVDWNLKPVMNHYMNANDWFISCASGKTDELVRLKESKSPTFYQDKQESGALNVIMGGFCMFGVGTQHSNAINLYGNSGS